MPSKRIILYLILFLVQKVYPALLAESVKACLIPSTFTLSKIDRENIAYCLDWQPNINNFCKGAYYLQKIEPLTAKTLYLEANRFQFSPVTQSQLSGQVTFKQENKIITADTAYIFRDAHSYKITTIELIDGVKFIENNQVIVAKRIRFNPQNKSGIIDQTLYRLTNPSKINLLPAWGRAERIERLVNNNYILDKATYSNCSPKDNAWEIKARRIVIDKQNAEGSARDVQLNIADIPMLYTPYLSFPISKQRKSGLLWPTFSSSNIGGFDFALPYYLNLAPNYDATVVPHVYTRRGLMLGGQFRYLNAYSNSVINGNFLPQDQAFKKFIKKSQTLYPSIMDNSANRWAFQLQNNSQLASNLSVNLSLQQVSDDYYLQDFSPNLAVLTSRQLLREGEVTYTNNHWWLKGMMQSYQTLQPYNETPIADIYERLPQLATRGYYDDLLGHSNLILIGEYDNFHWPRWDAFHPQGMRYHLNPIWSIPYQTYWGKLTPNVELVENNYRLQTNDIVNYPEINRLIPRYSIDSNVYFERSLGKLGYQTLEPRLYYLYVPYQNQTLVPVFDSAYMIFNTDQLFRTNRFSGFDRIGDTNQLSYAISSRWFENGSYEKASVTVGQIRYFQTRKVQLCQSFINNNCQDDWQTLGYLSPNALTSPIASQLNYHFNPNWAITGNYAWDTYTKSTNNANVSVYFQPMNNHIISANYSYLVNGDITTVVDSSKIAVNALHQITAAYAWPLNERFSTLGAYSFNLSKGYEMMSFLGLQYDSCCWAVRLFGSRSFQNLAMNLAPEYTNTIAIQVLLKGLGGLATNDPTTMIQTYLPGYNNHFR